MKFEIRDILIVRTCRKKARRNDVKTVLKNIPEGEKKAPFESQENRKSEDVEII